MSLIKKILCCVLLISGSFALKAATITGTVRDDSGDAIYYVNVFLANTQLGSTTNSEGVYQITDVGAGTYTLVFQHIGYELYAQRIVVDSLQESLRVDAALFPKIFKGKEVQVTAEQPVEWQNQLEVFKREFIGQSTFSEQCKLLNPEVLSFYVDEKGYLSAWADSLLRIENRALGYRIFVALDMFRWHIEGTRGGFIHYARYEELEPNNGNEKKRWRANRQRVYKFSSERFFVELSDQDLHDSTYTIYAELFNNLKRGEGERIATTRLYEALSDSMSMNLLKFPLDLQIDQNVALEKEPRSTLVYIPEGRILFDDYGNIANLTEVKFYGAWAQHRLADFLPADYRPQQKLEQ